MPEDHVRCNVCGEANGPSLSEYAHLCAEARAAIRQATGDPDAKIGVHGFVCWECTGSLGLGDRPETVH